MIISARKMILCSMGLMLVNAASSFAAFTYQNFGIDTYQVDTAAMDATLGITGYTIEDFEDVNLVSGLTVEFENPNAGPLNTLPQVIDFSIPGIINNYWDGIASLVNNTNQNWSTPDFAQSVTFHIAGGATSFGVGFANFEDFVTPPHRVFVNDVLLVEVDDLIGFTYGVQTRNGYLRIDATGGMIINSVTIAVNAANEDGLSFDHVAFINAVPEPSTLILLGTGLAGLIGYGRRRRMVG